MRKTAIALLAIGLVSALFFQGSFLHEMLIVAVSGWIVIPALAFAGINGLSGIIEGKSVGQVFRRRLLLISVLVVSLILSYAIGKGIYNLRVSATQHYAEGMVSNLADVKDRTGQYPATMPNSSCNPIYKRLSFPLSYSVENNDYRIEYDDPAGFWNGYYLTGSAPTWAYDGY